MLSKQGQRGPHMHSGFALSHKHGLHVLGPSTWAPRCYGDAQRVAMELRAISLTDVQKDAYLECMCVCVRVTVLSMSVYVSDYKAGHLEKVFVHIILDLLVCETIADGKELLGSESILWNVPSSTADKVISHATNIQKRVCSNEIWFQLQPSTDKMYCMTVHTNSVVPIN